MDEMTEKYYAKNAISYVEETVHSDMHEVCDRFLSFVKDGGAILDLGCGSGRDSLYFKERGYVVTAMDGSKELCVHAEKLLQQPVVWKDFMELCEEDMYDGIWACASLLHCHKEELSVVLHKMYRALKKNGVAYVSFKYGDYAGYRNGRYYLDMDEELLSGLLLQEPCFVEEVVWVSGDVQQRKEKWLNALLRKEG